MAQSAALMMGVPMLQVHSKTVNFRNGGSRVTTETRLFGVLIKEQVFETNGYNHVQGFGPLAVPTVPEAPDVN